MRCGIHRLVLLLLLGSLASIAHATQYPPGPGGLCPDSLTIVNIENPAFPCHPAIGDSVYGVGGICTAFDTKTSGVGFYMQISTGGAYTGINCFTANEIPPYFRGDSVVVETAQYTKYNGDPELTSLSGSWGHMIVRHVSSNHPLPPFHDGTVHEFNSAVSNTGADQWAGCLVRVTGGMRVARTAGVGSNWYVVDNIACPPGSVGPCDSMFVDGTTLPNPTYGQPPLGTVVSTIQGVYGLHSVYGPRIRIRDGNDVVAATPPHLSDAYSVHNDTIRVVFDRTVIQASAENTGNYSLTSAGSVNAAHLEANGSCVDLYITNGLSPGDNEGVTVQNVESASSGLPMANPETMNFFNGVIPIMTLRAPDPDSLLTIPCQDRSQFSGVGSGLGKRLTFRGICVGVLPGSLSYLEDASRAQRSAITGYGLPTVYGHQYLIACVTQEYFGETEAVYPAYIRDEGSVTVPAPVVQTVHVLRDSTCDVAQSITNGKDYASMLVELRSAMVTSDPFAPGVGFPVVDIQGYVPGDTIRINNRQGLAWTYQADSLAILDVLGVLRFDFGAYVVSPRSNLDFFVDPAERDSMETSATVELVGPGGPELVTLTGPTTVVVNTFDLADTDRDSLEEFQTEMVSLSLVGGSSLGPVTLRPRGVAEEPNRLILGKVEETRNDMPGRLELQPIVKGDTTTATSFFDVYFEIEIPGAGVVLHNHWPKHVTAVISHLPPLPPTTYLGVDSLTTLFFANDQVSPFSVGDVSHTIVRVLDVPPRALPTALAIQSIRPNPGVGSVRIELALPRRAATRLVAYDVSGRIVRRLLEGTYEAGMRSVVWDGRDDTGRRASAGMYFLKLESEGRASVRRVVMLR